MVSAFLANMSLWLRIEETKNRAALSMFVLSLAEVSNLQFGKHRQQAESGIATGTERPV